MTAEREQAVSLRATSIPRRSRTGIGPHDARSDELHNRQKPPLPRSPSGERSIEAIDRDDRLAHRGRPFVMPAADDDPFAIEVAIESTAMQEDDVYAEESHDNVYAKTSDDDVYAESGKDEVYVDMGKYWAEERETFALHLRRLRKDLETVLDVRVQWRQECQKLEGYRKYQHSATDALMSAVLGKGITTDSLESPKSRKKKKKRRTTKSSVDQTSVSHTDPTSAPNTGSSLSSTFGVGDSNIPRMDVSTLRDGGLGPSTNPDSGLGSSDQVSANKDSALGTSEAPAANIPDLYEQYTVSYRALQQQELVVHEHTSKLNSLEFRVKEMQTQLLATMRMPGFAEHLQGDLLDMELSISDPSSVASSESDTPALVLDFFDKSGDVGIFKGRIRELDIAHLEGLEVRDFLRDQDNEIELEVSDEQFEENYRLLRRDIELELERAEREVEILAALCKQAGLDPNAHRRQQVDVFVSTRPSRADESEESEPIAQARPVGVQMTQQGSGGLTAAARITGWMSQVDQAGPEDVPEAAPLDSALDDLSKAAPDAAPDAAPEAAAEPGPKGVPDATWGQLFQKLTENGYAYIFKEKTKQDPD
ncbi:hypothetical protein BDY17DRAFT_95781 [Neohortaea acidophila]|uniref:Uncharacterized protein n=1 Tax=Neohortaea acidophila TaxID=245834 RepID=A0A6A6PZ64_9PEZI|nr:uncharacterized protein BDY17DRAFT_95781 [Neohortaea acidophila]KAF2485049.1 hypothetical protein BDY17DRAFT_95781 [Neohortaea acidophila]